MAERSSLIRIVALITLASGVAMVCDVLSYVIQAVRWQLLLEPVGKIGFLQATQAIYAGLFTNEVLPMRPGEFARSYLASRWMGASFVAILPSIIVERLFSPCKPSPSG